MIRCRSCESSFLTVYARDSHVRAVHKLSVVIRTSDHDEVTIFRSAATGLFHCCFPTCKSSGFVRSDKLSRHYASIHFPGTNRSVDSLTVATNSSALLGQERNIPFSLSYGLPKQPTVLIPTSDLETPDFMLKTCLRRTTVCFRGLAVSFLVCIECSCVLEPLLVPLLFHLRKHQQLASPIATKRRPRKNPRLSSPSGDFCNTVDESSVRTFLLEGDFVSHESPVAKRWLQPPLSINTSVVPPVFGVPIVKGFQCADCGICFAAESSCKRHKSQEHGGKADFLVVSVQVLLPCIGRKYVRVDYSWNDMPDHTNAMNRLMESCQKMDSLGPSGLPTHKERSAWLRQSQWPEFASSFVPEKTSYKEIISLLRPSDVGNDPLGLIGPVLGAYMAKFKWLCRTIDYHFLRLVMGHDENGNVPTRGLRAHSVESTSDRYCKYLSQLVTGLLRSYVSAKTTTTGDGELSLTNASSPQLSAPTDISEADHEIDTAHLLGELSEDQLHHLGVLREELSSSFDEGAAPSLLPLHRLLLSLWTPQRTSFVNVTAKSSSTLLRFLLLTSLRQSFSENEGYAFQHVSTVTGRCSILCYWIRATILMEIGLEKWWHDSVGSDHSQGLGNEGSAHLTDEYVS